MKGLKRAFAIVAVTVAIVCTSISAKASGDVKIIYLDDKKVASIPVSPRGTVISFPTTPKKVILGRPGSFGIEYVEADLAISPLGPNSRSNLFVYMLGRRFTFDLFVAGNGLTIAQVRDSTETQLRVEVK